MSKADPKQRAYVFLFSYTAILLISLWAVIYAWGRTLTPYTYPTFSSIVATSKGMAMFQWSVFGLGVIWFFVLYNYMFTPRQRDWRFNMPLYRLMAAVLLFWALVGILIVGPSWATFHEVLTWFVYVCYVLIVEFSVGIHIRDTIEVYGKRGGWYAFTSVGKYRGFAIALEEAFLILAITFGALAFKMCTTDSECRQTYEFVSATFLSCFSVFYYMEIQLGR